MHSAQQIHTAPPESYISSWGKGLRRELCPLPRKFFVFFVENTIFDAF